MAVDAADRNRAERFIEIHGGNISLAKDRIRGLMDLRNNGNDLDGYIEATKLALAILEIEKERRVIT
ncbi:MAG: hypothetical protein F4Z40_00905 [Chloroflexi bacterium]|nr:hypothetical protein [Chloroflexota bacterium]